MDAKSKILLLVFVILIIGSVGFTYWRIMVQRDYAISAQTDCDPYVDKCFIWECDPNSTVEGEACTGDPEADIWYYQVVNRKAANIPSCDPNKDEECQALVCPEGEVGCETIFCDETTKEDQGVECSDPVQYAEENPIEEEECDPESEEECPAVAEECDPESEEKCPVAEEDVEATDDAEAEEEAGAATGAVKDVESAAAATSATVVGAIKDAL
ncbi:hypothetical protein EPO05_00740 [Patescibacteria group bacterium]|nr:MAG: hypothetical protein EPO05_00740 [Patescibacteria group bacterium]